MAPAAATPLSLEDPLEAGQAEEFMARSLRQIEDALRAARAEGAEETAKALEEELLQLRRAMREEFGRLRRRLGYSLRRIGPLIEIDPEAVTRFELGPEKKSSRPVPGRTLRLLRACLLLEEHGLLETFLRAEGLDPADRDPRGEADD